MTSSNVCPCDLWLVIGGGGEAFLLFPGESGGSGGARLPPPGFEPMRNHRRAPAAMMSTVEEPRPAAGEEGTSGLNWFIFCSKSLVIEVAVSLTIFLASQLVHVSGEFTPAILGCLKCSDFGWLVGCSPSVTVVKIINNNREIVLRLVLNLIFSVLFQAERFSLQLKNILVLFLTSMLWCWVRDV